MITETTPKTDLEPQENKREVIGKFTIEHYVLPHEVNSHNLTEYVPSEIVQEVDRLYMGVDHWEALSRTPKDANSAFSILYIVSDVETGQIVGTSRLNLLNYFSGVFEPETVLSISHTVISKEGIDVDDYKCVFDYLLQNGYFQARNEAQRRLDFFLGEFQKMKPNSEEYRKLEDLIEKYENTVRTLGRTPILTYDVSCNANMVANAFALSAIENGWATTPEVDKYERDNRESIFSMSNIGLQFGYYIPAWIYTKRGRVKYYYYITVGKHIEHAIEDVITHILDDEAFNDLLIEDDFLCNRNNPWVQHCRNTYLSTHGDFYKSDQLIGVKNVPFYYARRLCNIALKHLENVLSSRSILDDTKTNEICPL